MTRRMSNIRHNNIRMYKCMGVAGAASRITVVELRLWPEAKLENEYTQVDLQHTSRLSGSSGQNMAERHNNSNNNNNSEQNDNKWQMTSAKFCHLIEIFARRLKLSPTFWCEFLKVSLVLHASIRASCQSDGDVIPQLCMRMFNCIIIQKFYLQQKTQKQLPTKITLTNIQQTTTATTAGKQKLATTKKVIIINSSAN